MVRELTRTGEACGFNPPDNESDSIQSLIRIFSYANKILREDGIREGIDRFTEFAHLLFLKLLSERENEREARGEKRIIEKKYGWETLCSLDPGKMLSYINETIFPYLKEIFSEYGTLFINRLKIKNPDNCGKIISRLSAFTFMSTKSDIKGDALEYFIKNSVSVGNDLGEYYTPRHIVELIIDLIDPLWGESVYDPCCGTGGFLIQAVRHMKKNGCCADTYNNTIGNRVQKSGHGGNTSGNLIFNSGIPGNGFIHVHGREISETAKIAVMNMILLGNEYGTIIQQDSLKHPVDNQFDVVVTNFPFSQKTHYGNYYGFFTNDGNPAFLQHVINGLKPGGRAGVVVPDGLLFDKNSDYIKVRKNLVETCTLTAVIQLHPFVFRPYTGQPTSILIFTRQPRTQDVWFFDVRNDGFKKTGSKKGRPVSTENDLPIVRRLWKNKSPSAHSFFVHIQRIRDNDYILTMNTYKPGTMYTVPVKTIGELCDPPVIGGTPPRNNGPCWNGCHPWVKIADMGPRYINDTGEKITDRGVALSSVKLIPRGTLLFSFKLTIGKVGIAGKDLYTNEAIAGLIPKDKGDKSLIKYLYYILPTIDFTLYAHRAAKGYTLNAGSIMDIEIPFPERSIRNTIVSECEKKEEEKENLLNKINTLDRGIKTCIFNNTMQEKNQM